VTATMRACVGLIPPASTPPTVTPTSRPSAALTPTRRSGCAPTPALTLVLKVAVNRGRDKEQLARQLGAHDYIDSEAGDPAAALRAMGGAKAIIATVTSQEAMQTIVGGLGPSGTMMIIGAVPSLTVDPVELLNKRAAVKGWYSGTAVDSEDTMLFCERNAITSMNEMYPFEEAQAAYDRMMSGKARFRVVLTMPE
jgi:D-arabinose 1-dehydrogenase-like Zn-dependent alcohol dehydrogenase